MPSVTPIYLAGQTASGKSAVALLLAEKLGGEIISVDSMQVYRGMDIGTAKPSREERARIPHQLLDVAEIKESFSAARFADLASTAERDILARGRLPIYCGGTGFYFKAVLEGISPAPPSDEKVRAQLQNLDEKELLDELASRDPACFAVIDRHNLRRVMRAVEVIRISGRTFSSFKPNDAIGDFPQVIVLQREPGDLRRRINARIDRMMASGLVEEVRFLADRGLRESPTAREALGYKEVLSFLDGQACLAEATELLRIKTWQYSRRQATYFKRQLNTLAVGVSAEESVQSIADRVEAAWSGKARH